MSDLVLTTIDEGDDWRRPGDPRSLVFTFQEGQVIRMQSLKCRDEAFRLVAGQASG
jgi:hypothetical protein